SRTSSSRWVTAIPIRRSCSRVRRAWPSTKPAGSNNYSRLPIHCTTTPETPMHIAHATFLRAGFAAAVLALASATAAAADPYVIDANHTQVWFSYNHMGYSHISGHFDSVEGDFLFDAKDPTQSKIQVNVPINTVSVGVKALDDELRSE